jgi:hypothetical protein
LPNHVHANQLGAGILGMDARRIARMRSPSYWCANHTAMANASLRSS